MAMMPRTSVDCACGGGTGTEVVVTNTVCVSDCGTPLQVEVASFAGGLTVALDAPTLAALETINVIQSGAWTVGVSGSVAVTGPLTDAELRASPVPISGTVTITDGSGPVTVDGTVSITGSVAVTGPLTDTQLRASPVPISGTVTITDGSGPVTVDGTVSITGSVAVTGPLTDAQLRATPVPISGTVALDAPTLAALESITVQNGAGAGAVNIQDGGNSITVDGTVSVSGSVAVTGPLTDTQLRATPVPVSGTVTITDGSGPVTVDGTVAVTQSTSPWVVSGTVTTDTEFPAASALSDTDPNPTTTRVGANNLVYNGTTWDRVRAGTATGSVLVNNPTAANLNATIGNASGASAVNIQDGGNSITVDGTVGISGSVAVTGPLTDTQLRATPVPVSGTVTITDGSGPVTVDGTVSVSGSVAVTGPLTDTQLRATPVPVSGTVTITDGSGPVTVDGTVAVTQSTSPWVVSGTVITDTEFPAATALADADPNPTTTRVGANNLVFNGTTWDRVRAGTATGSVLVNNPTAANFNATIGNASGASAVNIQDGGNSITVDGTVSISGSVAVTGPLTDTQLRATPVPVSGTVTITDGSGPVTVDGTVAVTQSTSPWVVSGTVTADTELPAASALADADPNPTTSRVGANNLVYNGTTWDRVRAGTATGSVLVNNPTAANFNATVGNGSGASAVNIQDGGNSITVDGTVSVSGSVAVTGPLTDTQLRATPVPVSGTVTITDGSGPVTVDGTVAVTQSTSPWVVSGTVITDTEFPAAAVLADADPNPTTTRVGANNLVFNGTTWDRVRAGTATGSLLVNNPTAANLNATIGNASGAAAVNIQDGGNSITVDGTVGISGSVAVTGPLTDTQLRATPVPVSGTVTITDGSGPVTVDGTVAVTQSTSPWVVSGTVTADTELPAASALADADPNPTTSRVGANNLVFNGTTWDRVRAGTATGSVLVNSPTAANFNATIGNASGASAVNIQDGGNSITVDGTVSVSGSVAVTGPLTDAQLRATPVPVDSELPAASALADADPNPTTSRVGSNGLVYNGTTWDRVRSGTATGSVLVNNPTAANFNATIGNGSGAAAVNIQDGGNSITVDGTVSVSGSVAVTGPLTDTQLRASAVPVDTELSAASALADADPNPTTSRIGADNLVYNGTTWDRVRAGTATGSVLVNNPTSSNLRAKTEELNKLVPFQFDYINLSYTGDDITTVVYKTGGSGGTTVATLTLAYSTPGVLSTVTRT